MHSRIPLQLGCHINHLRAIRLNAEMCHTPIQDVKEGLRYSNEMDPRLMINVRVAQKQCMLGKDVEERGE